MNAPIEIRPAYAGRYPSQVAETLVREHADRARRHPGPPLGGAQVLGARGPDIHPDRCWHLSYRERFRRRSGVVPNPARHSVSPMTVGRTASIATDAVATFTWANGHADHAAARHGERIDA